jgi:hypothetical protein
MIKYEIIDTQHPTLKSAIIYSEEDIKDLFLDMSIYGVGTVRTSARATIQVPEKFMRQISEKTGIEIIDRVAQGASQEHKKYLILRLDQNIELLHAERK